MPTRFIPTSKRIRSLSIVFFALALVISNFAVQSPRLAEAQGSLTIDLGVKLPDIGVLGAAANNATGDAVAVGDLNGDNINDLVVGSPRERGPQSDPSGRPGGGVVRVFFGPIALNDQIDLASRQASVTVFGPATNDNLGANLLLADVNADGRRDLIMQAPGGDAGGARPDVGRIHILYGPLSPETRDLANQTTPASLQIVGLDPNDRLGNSLASGDFDGDGRADLAVGSPLSTINGATQGGGVFIIYGRPNFTGVLDLRDINQTPDDAFGIAVANTQFGSTVAFGDVDGDQRTDLICGAPRFDGASGTRSDSGAVFVLFAGKLENPFIGFGIEANDLLGSSLSVGDVNGDRLADVIVGAPGSFSVNNQRSGGGEVYVLIGGRLAPGQTRDLAVTGQGPEAIFFGGSPGDRLGFPYGTTVGDVNADGINDIVMVANGGDGPNNTRIDAGNAYIVLGSTSLFGNRDFAVPGTANVVVYGARSQDQIGSPIESAASALLRTGRPLAVGDLTGDGRGDLVVGAPFVDGPLSSPRTDAGAVYVLAQLAGPPPQNLPPVITPISNQVIAEGQSTTVAISATDPNGDGIKFTLNGPAFVSLADNGNGTGQLLILPPINTPKQVYSVILSATDTANPPLTTAATFTVTVTAAGPIINTVSYDGKFLTVNGTKLSPSPTLKVNGNILATKVIKTATDSVVKAKGSQSKLKLQSGNNTIIVIVNGVESNAAVLPL